MGQNRSLYLADDVLEYLGKHQNASAEVNKLVRWKIARDAEADAFRRVHGVPLTDERRAHARRWAREQLAVADAQAKAGQDARDELRRRMGWTA
jgi:hypothetical protein